MEDLERRLARVRDDNEHGSRWLVREAVLLLRDLANESGVSEQLRLQRVQAAGSELTRARPAMAALAGAVARVLRAGRDAASLARAAEQVLRGLEQAGELVSEHARPLLHGIILTHSLSGTVLEVLQACRQALEQIIILEGRPLYEGRALARSLSGLGVPLTVITDAQAEIFLPSCQALVTGADSILADGGILNKAGTVLIARAARAHGVPFYVLSETLKITPGNWTGDPRLLEEHPGHEVWSPDEPQIAVRNFYFDYTPAELITRVITERGPLDRAEIAALASELSPM